MSIYPNVVVIGPIRVGEGAVIGAGSAVLRDAPPGAVVAQSRAHPQAAGFVRRGATGDALTDIR